MISSRLALPCMVGGSLSRILKWISGGVASRFASNADEGGDVYE